MILSPPWLRLMAATADQRARAMSRVPFRPAQASFELRQSLDDAPLAVSASEFLAYALVDAGQVAHGMALLLDATGGPEMPRIGVHCRAVPDEVLTRGALSLGSVAEAAEWASRAELCARDGQLRLTVAAARGARAVVLLEKGTPWLLEISPSRPWHSDSRLRRRSRWRTPRVLVARALGRAGRRDDAIRILEQALEKDGRCAPRVCSSS